MTKENQVNTVSEIKKRKKTRVYLDNCAHNRPYDDQSFAKIELETQAKLKIQRMIKESDIELASSYMSLYECGENPDVTKAELVTDFIDKNTSAFVGVAHKTEIEDKAKEIMTSGIKFKDACHIAAAIYASADYLITTDIRMLKYKTDEIKLINPIEYFFDDDTESTGIQNSMEE